MGHRFFSAMLLFGLVSTAMALPDVQQWQTRNGAKVLYVHAPELPMVDVRVVFDAGSARDGRLYGLASFTNSMLDQGAGKWDTDQLAEIIEDNGIEIGNGALRDMAWIQIRSLTDPKPLEVALSVLSAILSEPRFTAEDSSRIREQMLIGLRQSLQSPGNVAKRLFYKNLYGDHPYGHLPSGENESLSRITHKDLHSFHLEYYVARNAVVSIVGDVDKQRAMAIAEQVMGGLPAGQHAAAIPKPNEVKASVLSETFPSSQTHILVGQTGMGRYDPDYFPLYVGNHALGGSGLVSILGEEVRNKRGLSYSVYSYFSPMRAAGPFIMTAQTKNAKAEETLAVMRETLEKYVDEGPTAEQLKASKQNIMGGFPLKISSNKKIVEYIAMMGFYDYPLTWLETLVAKVDAITLEQVKDAFKRRVHPDAMVAIIVGGAE